MKPILKKVFVIGHFWFNVGDTNDSNFGQYYWFRLCYVIGLWTNCFRKTFRFPNDYPKAFFVAHCQKHRIVNFEGDAATNVLRITTLSIMFSSSISLLAFSMILSIASSLPIKANPVATEDSSDSPMNSAPIVVDGGC